mgnify:CR=1 FL=1
MTFCEKLRQLRSIKGCTQHEVALTLNVSDSCYRNYEKGIREPSLAGLKDICDFFDVSADYLIGRVDYY